ncbi:peptide-methionine (S)-S-oxide reductase MsrA [Candidatus Woesearchaeota archaeon]|nr:peptide-methionine (S)-S-oxide reductase MsrA [Candidatus Woesearchaeota archaeon]
MEKNKIITFGMGCFWGAQDIFDKVGGVKETIVGYMGGESKNPTYEEICSGNGHTEVVQVRYNKEKVSVKELIEVFFKSHNPELKNKEQYKSVVFYYDKKQKEAAEDLKKDFYATEILPAEDFWKAEEYHQHYFKKNNTKT